MENNIVTAVYSESGTSETGPVYQWDYGLTLKLEGFINLPETFEIHFSNNEYFGESVSAIGADGEVSVPNSVLEDGRNILAWIYLHDSNTDGETVYKIQIPVTMRPQVAQDESEQEQDDDDWQDTQTSSHVVTAVYSETGISQTSPVHQWDYGIALQLEGFTELPETFEVHFSNNAFFGDSIAVIGADGMVNIPNSMTTDGRDIRAWIYSHEGENDGETVYKIQIPVIMRPRVVEEDPEQEQPEIVIPTDTPTRVPMGNNTVTAVYSESGITKTAPVYQWNYGMVLKLQGFNNLPETFEVHFSNNALFGDSVATLGTDGIADIPNSVLSGGRNIWVWIYSHDGEEDGETVYKIQIPIIQRPKVVHGDPTPEQINIITQAIIALNTAVGKAEAAMAMAEEAAAMSRAILDEFESIFTDGLILDDGDASDLDSDGGAEEEEP